MSVRPGKYGQVVLTTPTGKYFWTPLLQMVEYFPKGKRRSAWDKGLDQKRNTLRGAVRAACDHAKDTA